MRCGYLPKYFSPSAERLPVLLHRQKLRSAEQKGGLSEGLPLASCAFAQAKVARATGRGRKRETFKVKIKEISKVKIKTSKAPNIFFLQYIS
jgi:hypothetical protein